MEDEYASRHVPIDASEVHWARRRPARHRTGRPEVGDRLVYRHDQWGPVSPACLVGYAEPPGDTPDLMVWRYVLDGRSPSRDPVVDGGGRRLVELVDDPWWLVLLDTDYGRVTTREARVRGSAGWLPLDWRARYRPRPATAALLAATAAQMSALSSAAAGGAPWAPPPPPGGRPVPRP